MSSPTYTANSTATKDGFSGQVRKALKDRRFEMIGAVYDLETGKVSMLL